LKVLDKGKLELIDFMGSDEKVISMATISTDKEIVKERYESFIYSLVMKGHHVPFEHCQFTFYIKAPIFVLRQLMRYRTGSYSERSMRYTEGLADFYNPDSNQAIEKLNDNECDLYYDLRKERNKKEMARIVYSLNIYSELYMTIDLRNLINFLSFRTDKHTQKESREYANKIIEILEQYNCFKYSVKAIKDYIKLYQHIRSFHTEKDLKNIYRMMIDYKNNKGEK